MYEIGPYCPNYSTKLQRNLTDVRAKIFYPFLTSTANRPYASDGANRADDDEDCGQIMIYLFQK